MASSLGLHHRRLSKRALIARTMPLRVCTRRAILSSLSGSGRRRGGSALSLGHRGRWRGRQSNVEDDHVRDLPLDTDERGLTVRSLGDRVTLGDGVRSGMRRVSGSSPTTRTDAYGYTSLRRPKGTDDRRESHDEQHQGRETDDEQSALAAEPR